MTWRTTRLLPDFPTLTRLAAVCDELGCRQRIELTAEGGAGLVKTLVRAQGWVLSPYTRGSIAYCPEHRKIPMFRLAEAKEEHEYRWAGTPYAHAYPANLYELWTIKENDVSTNDVPGHKPENHDQLAMGSWAKHEDGSLIFVQSVENKRVVYMLFDMSRMPPRRWQGAMDETKFKRHFSWDPKKARTDPTHFKWTWHDKTPFPWDDVMEEIDEEPMVKTAGEIQSAAERVAEALGLRAEEVKREDIAHRGEQTRPGTAAGTEIMQRLRRALDAFFEDPR